MPPVLSYKWRRDPEHLVQKAGLGSRVQSWSEEKRFLKALDAMPDCPERVHRTAVYMDDIMKKAEEDILMELLS